MTKKYDAESLLRQIERSIGESSPFDISPRGIRFRPDTEVSAQIDALVALGDIAVMALADRLDATDDPLMAIVWLHCLQKITTPASRAAFDAALNRMQSHDRWAGEFPGLCEVLLFAGRSS